MTGGHAQAVRDFRWRVPARFNIAQSACRRWARRPRPPRPVLGGRVGATAAFTYWDLEQASNRLSTRSARWASRAASASRSSCPSAWSRWWPTSRASRWARSRSRSRTCSAPTPRAPARRQRREGGDRRPGHAAQPVAAAGEAAGARARDRRGGARARRACTPGRTSSRRPRAASSAPARPRATRPSSSTRAAPRARPRARSCRSRSSWATCRASSTRTTASETGRPLLVAGGLGVDGRALGRAHAHAAPRAAIVGYRGRFDPERAFHLLDKYAVRNAFLFPTALKMMRKAVERPRALRPGPALADERRRGPGAGAARVVPRGAGRHGERDLRADGDQLHRGPTRTACGR